MSRLILLPQRWNFTLGRLMTVNPFLIGGMRLRSEQICPLARNTNLVFRKKIKPKPDYPLKTLYPRAFQTGLNRLIYYDFTTVE